MSASRSWWVCVAVCVLWTATSHRRPTTHHGTRDDNAHDRPGSGFYKALEVDGFSEDQGVTSRSMSLPVALGHEHPIAMAHRGSGLLWPENTMVAFQGAADLGYRYLETDLQITRDGVLVTIHDDTVNRTTDGTGLVSDYSLQELQTLDAGYRFERDGDNPHRGRGIRVPTLEELAITYPDGVFTLDLKSDGMEAALVDLIRRLDLWDRVIVGSFSGSRLRRFRALVDRPVATSAGPSEILRFLAAARTHLPYRPRADSFQVPVKDRGITIVNPRTVRAARRLGIPLIVWTINHLAEMEGLLDLGVDGLITDRPDLLRTLLAKRSRKPDWKEPLDG